MDFILSYNNNEVTLVFPVVENEGIDLESPQSNGSFDSLNGEMNTIGTMGLRSCSIASIFPTHDYPWMRPRSSSDGWDYVRKIEAGRKRFVPFRAILLNNDGSEIFNMRRCGRWCSSIAEAGSTASCRPSEWRRLYNM